MFRFMRCVSLAFLLCQSLWFSTAFATSIGRSADKTSSLESEKASTDLGGLQMAEARSESVAVSSQRIKIAAIRVKGNQRIEKSTIENYLAMPVGSDFDDAKLSEGVKHLYETGLFGDVDARLRGDEVEVTVVENPVVSQVSFEGNKRIEDDKLLPEIKLTPRSVYTKSKLQADVKRLQEVYRQHGRYAVKVEPKIINKDQNRVDLVYEIEEGPKANVDQILFVGNKHFSDNRLLGIVSTKESHWYRFFSSTDTYDPDRLSFDKELLRKFYVQRGYADFQVVSVTSDLNPKQDGFIVTYTVDEGIKYNFGDISVNSAFKNLEKNKLMEKVKTKKGQLFDAKQVEKSVDSLVEYATDHGYAFADVDPQYKRDAKARTVSVVYQIKEGPKVYVNRIDINGNNRTLDKVVRREFRIQEGDPYNAEQIRRSKERIQNLAFFERVNVDNKPTQYPDKVDIDVNVKEKSTGELTFGAGYSTTDGIVGNVSIRERNLLGKGQDLKLSFERGQRGMQIDLGFTEPYFMDRNIAAGFDVFKISRDNTDESSYSIDTVGGTLRASYDITEYLTHSVHYSLRKDDIQDVNAASSVFVQAQQGEHTTSSIGHTLMYDKRDSKFNPSKGYYLRLNQEFAGVGGDGQFIRNELRTGVFFPVLTDDVVFKLVGKGGNIFGWGGEDVRLSDRFFVGGQQVRGFKSSGVGPRDSATADALGGNNYYVGTTELEFPLGTPDELGLRGAIFVDAGSLWGTDDSGATLQDSNSLRVSVGAGLAWSSPLGPIRIDLAEAIKKEDFDETELIRFNFGTQF
ncbi:MAG: outer membrane protein assembly factor BamA [Alphaproteobacteria bacterium]|nr:outer membrane protein assembly factor BamA [Alphaproteobacteria bacterium]